VPAARTSSGQHPPAGNRRQNLEKGRSYGSTDPQRSRPARSYAVACRPFWPIPLGSELATHERPVARGGLAPANPGYPPTAGQATTRERHPRWEKRKKKTKELPCTVRLGTLDRSRTHPATEGASQGFGGGNEHPDREHGCERNSSTDGSTSSEDATMNRGRPPMGPKIVQHLDGPDDTKRRLKVLLETLADQCSVADACAKLGISEARFHELRSSPNKSRSSWPTSESSHSSHHPPHPDTMAPAR
jgi:hypothetical protein